MSRSEIIEKLCNLILDNPDQKSNANAILLDLTRGRINVPQAIEQYNNLVNDKPGYWIGKLKPKVVYEALKKYQRGEQSLLDTSKMISSLITHAIIEMQHNPSVTQYDLGIPELISLLNNSLLNDPPDGFQSRADLVLKKYGYLDEKEGE